MSRTPLPEIIDVADAIMTDGARWEVLTSLHATGAISDVEYLRRIEPNMLGHMQGYGIDPESRFAEIRGIDASAGQVLGRVAFRGFDRSEFEDLPPVLFIEESTPEDIHDIDSSGAVVSSRGGKSSHAAVICRGMGMPCVVGCSTLVVHERNRLALLGNGLSVPERMPVLVNGTIGIVEFSDTGHLVPSFVTSREVGGRLNHLTTVLRNVTVMDRFKRLSVDDQTHVATLKYRLRELRLS